MANIKDKIENIRKAVFGKDVRGSLADGLDAVNKETESTTSKQTHLEKTFDQLVINAGNSNSEIVDARVDKINNNYYEKLGDRLDAHSALMEDIEQKKRNKNVLINELDISDSLKQQINGKAPILQTIADDIISERKTNFIKSLNRFDKDNIIAGRLSDFDGSVLIDENYKTSDFIKVMPNASLYFNNSIGGYCFYDVNMKFISGQVGISIKQLNTISTAYYIRIYVWLTLPNVLVITENEPLPFEYTPFKLQISKELLPTPNEKYMPKINIPSKLYTLKGEFIQLFFENIIRNSKKYDIDVVSSKGIHLKESLLVTSDFEGSIPISINVYEDGSLLNSSNTTLYSKLSTVGTGTKKCMFIGDSITDFGVYTQQLLDLFSTDNMKISLLGTRGSSLNKHEGRAGWSALIYNTMASMVDYQGTTVNNAFWDSTTGSFNFSKYMTTQSYANVDYVFLNLGTNDIFNFNNEDEAKVGIPSILSNFDKMINSIHAYNPNVKVCLMLTIPPNENQDAFGNSYGCGRTQWTFRIVYDLWVSQVIAKYKDSESQNIYLVPTNIGINCATDIADTVHPANPNGFKSISKAVYSFIKNTVL